jgi:hypothetical protein
MKTWIKQCDNRVRIWTNIYLQISMNIVDNYLLADVHEFYKRLRKISYGFIRQHMLLNTFL